MKKSAFVKTVILMLLLLCSANMQGKFPLVLRGLSKSSVETFLRGSGFYGPITPIPHNFEPIIEARLCSGLIEKTITTPIYTNTIPILRNNVPANKTDLKITPSLRLDRSFSPDIHSLPNRAASSNPKSSSTLESKGLNHAPQKESEDLIDKIYMDLEIEMPGIFDYDYHYIKEGEKLYYVIIPVEYGNPFAGAA